MRYKAVVAYDGSAYHGFQIQGKDNTVQAELEAVLAIIHKKHVTIYPAGRTDAGVHAIGQVFHFNSDIEMNDHNMQNAINSRLPRNIYIKSIAHVGDDFHARFSCKSKVYEYLIDTGEYNPLLMNYRTYYRHQLNIEAMKEALALVQGEHDFKSFTKNHRLENTTRELYEASLTVEGSLLRLRFHGNGFMHNMVRIIVAMVMEVGKGKLKPADLLAILEAKNRRLAPKTAPANGLYLLEVCY